MFDFITDSIENTLDVVDAVLSSEDVTKQQVARLIADGLRTAGNVMSIEGNHSLTRSAFLPANIETRRTQ